ncbi:MAG TPA: phosphoribosyl-ATP diphosphatase [Gemmatimonadaceae bacterium]|jgi:phosphoribosyl-ATP pyrophosphohydrolase/phosphoribosyl-AMP cyclohydrolase|nr:phosphoribosyl-ATP diphosphatase [Gemmatimonadaceae bacterium]
MSASLNLDAVRFDKETKTVVVVAQDVVSGRVLMVANADREALERTIETGEMHYRSRTRGLWRKGATSGNVQRVVSLTPDCDSDAIVARVRSAGPACHTGAVSCFDDSAGAPSIWSVLATTISQRNAELKAQPKADKQSESKASSKRRSHTRELLLDRNLRLKKIGEESAELIAACADGDVNRATEEAADLIYHVGVALEAIGSSLDSVARILWERSVSPPKPNEY